jgi:hypothetical protein
MSSPLNPYAPPQEEPVPPPRPPSAEVLASCTVVVKRGKEKGRRRIARWVRGALYPTLAGILCFTMAEPAGRAVQIEAALLGSGVVAVAMLIASTRRKRAREPTADYRFYEDGFDVTTGSSLTRVEWTSIH